jgi:hypothetical protein
MQGCRSDRFRDYYHDASLRRCSSVERAPLLYASFVLDRRCLGDAHMPWCSAFYV